MMNKCLGCGANLQNTHKDEVGYTPKKDLSKVKYCERCFKINNYNSKFITTLDNVNNYIIKEVNKKAKYVYFMIDFLNINNETINSFNQLKCPKSLIISKLDIIPKSINKDRLTNFLKKNYNIKENIYYQSTKKNLNNKILIKNIVEQGIKEVYILGYTNSGKSNLINKINSYFNENIEKITTSSIPNTTIDFIKIKVSDELVLVDSPGFILNNVIYKMDEYDLIERVNPKKYLKPLTYQTKENTAFEIEDKIRIDANSVNSFTFYISNELKIKRLFNDSDKLTNLDKIELHIEANSDLIIKSLGFINIKKACDLSIYTCNKELFEIRNSIFEVVNK